MQILNLYSTNTSYRGVKYDTHTEHKHEVKEFTMNYRGGSYTKKVEVVSWHNLKSIKPTGFLSLRQSK